MDKIFERLDFFHQLICSTNPLSLWSYGSDFSLRDASNSDLSFVIEIEVSDIIRKHVEAGHRTPLICSTAIGLIWIVGFSCEDGEQKDIVLLGPAKTGQEPEELLLRKLDTYDLSIPSRRRITEAVLKIPIISTGTLVNYAVMLHYTLNSENIPLSEIVFSLRDNQDASIQKLLTEEHRGIWEAEQRLCKLFEEGSPDIEDAILSELVLSSGLKMSTQENVRIHKNNALVLLTLCSRACIRGGLLPAIAYDLNDYYATLLEKCCTQGAVAKLCLDMANDYASQIRRIKDHKNISPAVQNACYYIQHHLTESLGIELLAKRAGYSEYYFSHKFQRETGYSVKKFILNEKIAQAQIMLKGSNIGIQEVSDTLGFSSSSYFSTCFQKKTGMSPSQYRFSS